jgi:hypothetical protein
MREVTTVTKVFNFKELNKETQQKAIEKLYDINVMHEWWDFCYEDAKTVGVEIKGFDLGRAQSIEIDFVDACYDIATAIKENWGENCNGVVQSAEFIEKWDNLVSDHSDGVTTDKVHEDNVDEFDEQADEIEDEYKKQLKWVFFLLLRDNYDYLVSDEAIEETIEANDYEFTEDGELF